MPDSAETHIIEVARAAWRAAMRRVAKSYCGPLRAGDLRHSVRVANGGGSEHLVPAPTVACCAPRMGFCPLNRKEGSKKWLRKSEQRYKWKLRA